MTFEELQKEAKRQGYSLIKKKPYVKFERCICGHNSHLIGYDSRTNHVRYVCAYCHLKGPYGPTRSAAKDLWNDMIRAKKGETDEQI